MSKGSIVPKVAVALCCLATLVSGCGGHRSGSAAPADAEVSGTVCQRLKDSADVQALPSALPKAVFGDSDAKKTIQRAAEELSRGAEDAGLDSAEREAASALRRVISDPPTQELVANTQAALDRLAKKVSEVCE